jgi:hypothetical protein
MEVSEFRIEAVWESVQWEWEELRKVASEE